MDGRRQLEAVLDNWASLKLKASVLRLPVVLPNQAHRRWILAALVVAVVLVGVSAGLWELWTAVLGRLHLHEGLTWYGLGLYGLAPTVQFRSFAPAAPWLEFLRTDSRCSRDYVLFGWRGPNVAEPAAVILDGAGEMVWLREGFGGDQEDIKVQTYRGKQVLTFWGSSPDMRGTNQGCWYMMDETYTVTHRIEPPGFAHGDIHEFVLTGDDTALVTVYDAVPRDLSAIGGPTEGWLLDNYFQELDVETGEVLFQWQASEHFGLNLTMASQDDCDPNPSAPFAGCGFDSTSGFDFFHLNSVHKDSRGNYLISARHVFAVAYISGADGSVLWTLGGGKTNDFADLSAGAATDFRWQHHARWVVEGERLSLFNNDYHSFRDPGASSGHESRGMILDLDQGRREVSLRATYAHPNHLLSESQGNMQVLPGSGNVLIGWGSSAAFTEFGPGGDVLCDARFGAEALFSFAPVSSYRVFRAPWTGRPAYPPDAVFVDGSLFVSWNGATEVDRWQVEVVSEEERRRPQKEGEEDVEDDSGGHGDDTARPSAYHHHHPHPNHDRPGRVIAQQFRTGFETQIGLPLPPPGQPPYSAVQVVALDKEGRRLGASPPVDVANHGWWSSTSSSSASPLEIVVVGAGSLLCVLAALVGGGGWYYWFVWRRRRARRREGYELVDRHGD